MRSFDLSWFPPALLTILALGLMLAIAVGALLVIRPSLLFAINTRLSRWIDTGERFRALERPRYWERYFYRHHRVLGTLVTFGAGYVLWSWAFAYERAALISVLPPRIVHGGLDWIVAALETLLVLLHGVILLVGLVILFRPSLLKSVERRANVWHGGSVTSRLDTIVGPLDRGLALFPRVSGLVLLAAAAGSLAQLLPVVLQALAR